MFSHGWKLLFSLSTVKLNENCTCVNAGARNQGIALRLGTTMCFFSHKNLHTASVKAVGEIWL